MPEGSEQLAERADGPSSPEPNGSVRSYDVWDFFLLLAVGLFGPLMVWVNSAENPSPVGFVILGSAAVAFAVAARWTMLRLGLDSSGATFASAVLIFGVTNGGILLDRGFDRSLVVVLVLAAAAIVYALRESGVLRAAVLWVGIFVLAYPWLVWLSPGDDPGERMTEDPAPLEAKMTGQQRDIVLVVLDGYGNSNVLREIYGFDNSPFEADLRSSGFEVSSQTIPNYGRTRLSVASVLQLQHPIQPGPYVRADFDHLLNVIGGENLLAQWLVGNGYTHTYVESGWFGTRCRSTVDVCVEGPWPNESLYDVTNRSLLQDLPGLETGRSFSRGANRALEWLDDSLDPLLDNDRPDFVYVHVLAPHPPLFLDANCVLHPQDGFKGFTIAQPGMSDTQLDEARDWYVSQVQCVNSHLAALAEDADAKDAIMIMMGDHGPDSLGQLFAAGADWDEDQRFERMSAMLAARAPGCDMTAIETLVNVGRRLISCLSDIDFPDLPTQTFESRPTADGEELVEIEPPSPRVVP